MESSSKPKTLFFSINPRPDWTKERTLIFFPLGLAYVISEVERNGYEFDLLDLQVNPMSDEDIIKHCQNNHYDVVALGTISNAYHLIKPIMALIRKCLPKATIVVGNSVATSNPELLLANTEADIAVVGDGEYTMVEILDRITANQDFKSILGIAYQNSDSEFIKEPERPIVKVLDTIPPPNWDIFDVEAYIQSSKNHENPRSFSYIKNMRPFFMMTQKGCPYRCTFCYNAFYYKFNKFREHSPDYIVNKMRMLKEKYDVNFLWLVDELTFLSPKHSEPLIDRLIEEDLGIYYQATARVGFLKDGDEEFAKKLKKSGCINLTYSVESGSQAILETMQKKINARDFVAQKQICDEAGIVTTTSLVLGYPEETEQTLAETFDLMYETSTYPSSGFLMPLPGTPIYDWALEEGYIKNEEAYLLSMGDRQYMHLNMTQLSRERLSELTDYHLGRIRDKLNLPIADKELMRHTKLKKEDPKAAKFTESAEMTF